MQKPKLDGVIVASVTPFTADKKVDEYAIGRLITYYQAHNLDGVFINSSSGEYFAMTQPQREQALLAATKFIADNPMHSKKPFWILAGISADNMEEAICNGLKAAELGADVAVAMPPRFYTYNDDELVLFFYSIAEALPIPLMIYNHMIRLNNKLSIDCVVRLSDHPNIIGIKDTHNDAVRLMNLLEIFRKNDHFSVFAGGDALAGISALMGGCQMNALCAVAPNLFLRLQEAGSRQDVDTVMNLQKDVYSLMRLYTLIQRPGNSMSAFSQSLKAALKSMGLCDTYTAQLGFMIDEKEMSTVRDFIHPFIYS